MCRLGYLLKRRALLERCTPQHSRVASHSLSKLFQDHRVCIEEHSPVAATYTLSAGCSTEHDEAVGVLRCMLIFTVFLYDFGQSEDAVTVETAYAASLSMDVGGCLLDQRLDGRLCDTR